MSIVRQYQASPALEAFILSVAPAYRVDVNGPASWDELRAARDVWPLPVNPQSAEGSIYSRVAVNLAFRAWHDSIHLALDVGFDHPGEHAVALEHQNQARAAGLSEEDLRALWADTWLTFRYQEKYGYFPVNPRAFVAGCLDREVFGGFSE